MAGFWEKILDYFTRIDDILSQFKEEYVKGNQELIAAIRGEEPTPPVPIRHVPFYVEDRVEVGTDHVLLVKDDSEQGLGDVGKTGFIANDGVDHLHVIIDDGVGKSKEVRIDVGERLIVDRDDNIWVDKLTLISKESFVDYRCYFAR